MTYDADTAPDGEKTLFMVRAITLSQRAEIIDRNQVFTDKDVRYCTTEVVDLVSYLVARIDHAGREIDYEDREFCGRQVRCVARTWIDENMPVKVLLNIFDQAKKLHGIVGSEAQTAGA
ncbi:MAG: hypothetical protein NTV22_08725 [bacterium]|nr:hypothetical protein [bacterium]